jgi:hypothetical protein
MAAPPDDDLQEIRRRGQLLLDSINEQLRALSAREYPTDSPRQFITYLQRLVVGLSALLVETDNADWGKLVCQFSKDVASHIRFLESASYPRIPWALIKPMEELITAIVPGSRIVLRSQWLWNYKIRPISELYKKSLDALPHKYFQTSVYAPTHRIWNVVSLPRVDSGNILMHVILGHEVGHRIAEQFLERLDSDKATSDAIAKKIRDSIGDATWADPDIGKLGPMRMLAFKGRLYKIIDSMRIGALQELISDSVALHVFGPSFLFAIYEASLDASLDGLPQSPQYHPQWRYRYRFVMEEFARRRYGDLLASIDGSDVARAVRDACIKRIEQIRALTASSSDKVARDNDEFAKRAYPLVEDVLTDVPDFVAGQVKAVAFNSGRFKAKLEEALRLLALGIPPAVRDPHGGDFRYAILAGWCYKSARLPIPMDRPEPWTIEDDVTLGRLIHKALEYRITTEEYDVWKKGRSKR